MTEHFFYQVFPGALWAFWAEEDDGSRSIELVSRWRPLTPGDTRAASHVIRDLAVRRLGVAFVIELFDGRTETRETRSSN
jgi:hypothetical protein